MSSQAARPDRILLFDGVCAFCNGAVRWLLQHDTRSRLHFAPLQGETASDLRRRHPEIPDELETMVYVEALPGGDGERIWFRSEALFRLLRDLGFPWSWFSALRVLPRRLTDAAYRAFVRRRYRWFGELDACPLPPPEIRTRFLA